jgi:hypothetical protein
MNAPTKEPLSPAAYLQFRRWQRAMLSGSKPCPAGCGRTVSMNAKACRACAEAISISITKVPEQVAA